MEQTMLERLEAAAPYNLFCNVLSESKSTSQKIDAIHFKDLLCPSLGQLKCSLQVNYMIHVPWLMEQYESQNLGTVPITLVYGRDLDRESEEYLDGGLPNITNDLVEVDNHHSKISVLVYEDNSLRVVVSSANLHQIEWDSFNQQIWVSPLCPELPESASDTSGESPTNFKLSLVEYFESYNLKILEPFINYVKRANFKDVKVFLITSIPRHLCHLDTVGELLPLYCSLPPNEAFSWPIIAQVPSVTTCDKSLSKWLPSTFFKQLASHDRSKMVFSSRAPVKIICPSVRNVKKGYQRSSRNIDTSEKEEWLQGYLHQWKADSVGRSRAMPHDKIYCRISPCWGKLAWFLLTSGKLAREAWELKCWDENKGVFMGSYEVGVMFFPKFFREKYFEIGEKGENGKRFPFIPDVPLKEYEKRDYPFSS